MALPRPGTVTDLINGLLDRGYNSTVQPVLSAVANSTSTGLMERRLAELEAEAQRLSAAGEKLDPQNPVLRAVLADLETTMQGNARLLDTAAGPLQSSAGDAAGTIQRQLAIPGVTDAQLSRLGVSWNRPDPEAIARLVNYAGSDAWQNELARYGGGVVDIVQNQAIRGIVSGWNPLRTAREISRITTDLPAYQANNLLRTLQLTAYRDATAAHQNANRDIAQRVIRIAALDLRTCLACIDQHGEALWDSETNPNGVIPRVNDHHSGRCTSFIEIKGYTWNIQRGSDWFASLPPDRQRQQYSFLNSPGKFEAYASGRLNLSDFVGSYHDPVFGEMMREASLSGAMGNTTGQIYTMSGVYQRDNLSPGNTVESLTEYLQQSTGALAEALVDSDMLMISFGNGFEVTLNQDNIAEAARRFVRESQDVQYGRDYILSLVQEDAREKGINVDLNGAARLYNQHFSVQAEAIRTAATAGNVRLTPAQQRRLDTAIRGGYLDMQYTTESSVNGSLANALKRDRGALTDIELRQARENFRQWVQGID